jgi:hypothetical protein
MNNTTRTRTLTAIVAVLMAATLVVGTLAATTTTLTQTAFAYSQKKKGGGDENSRNGNTITIQKCKQAAIQSGWDNDQSQECENLICTHPGENATCVQEGAAAAQTPAPVKKTTCEQCFTSILDQTQIMNILSTHTFPTTLAELCGTLIANQRSETEFREGLIEDNVTPAQADALIACLKAVGIVFRP